MCARRQCSKCGKEFHVDNPRSVGPIWQPVDAAMCPECGIENCLALDMGSFDIDGFIAKRVDEKYAAKKGKMPIEQRVEVDKVREYWVQQYIAANYGRLGFQGLEGPFEQGPDFRVQHKGKWVLAEAEIVCENYIKHKHHENPKWASCSILIVLSEKIPDKGKNKQLPTTIINLDKAHFTEWYRTAARNYALAREKEEPAKKSYEKADLQLQMLASEIRKRFGVPHDESGGEDMRVFDDLAFEFVAQWMRGKGEEFRLAEVTVEAINGFCQSVSGRVRESAANLPVFYTRYCGKCDNTLIIRASREPGYADYEQVICPHCKINLGKIRPDLGFAIIGEKKGNHGNSEWQG